MSRNQPANGVRRIAIQILIGIGIFSTIVGMATFAYCLQGWSLGDAFYMVIITIFGVGYEEVRPVDTPIKRLITILTIIAGPVATVYVIGSLVKIITEREFERAMKAHQKSKNMDKITRHTIICGFGRIGQTIAREMLKDGKPFLVLDRDKERIALSESFGYLTLEGDAGDEETLLRAGIARALNFAAVLPNDMANVFIALTARNMNPTLRIIARAEDPATEKKLRQAGANEVIMPALAGGLQIAHRIIRPSLMGILADDTTFLKNDLEEVGVCLEETAIESGHRFENKPISTFIEEVKGRSIVLLVRHADGSNSQYPASHHILQSGDKIVCLMRKSA